MFTPWNSFSACLLAKNDRITVECLNLVRQSIVIPLEFGHSLSRAPIELHQLTTRVELFYFACHMKLVLRLDVGRWSRILRVWKIVKNRDLTPDDKRFGIPLNVGFYSAIFALVLPQIPLTLRNAVLASRI